MEVSAINMYTTQEYQTEKTIFVLLFIVATARNFSIVCVFSYMAHVGDDIDNDCEVCVTVRNFVCALTTTLGVHLLVTRKT